MRLGIHDQAAAFVLLNRREHARLAPNAGAATNYERLPIVSTAIMTVKERVTLWDQSPD